MRAVCIRKKDGGGHTLVNGEGKRILALVILSMFPRKVAFTTCRSKDRTAQVAANLSKACVPNVVSRLVVGLYTFERLRFDVDRASIRANRFTRLCARIMGTHASYTRISAFGDWRRVWSLLIVSRIILIPLNERIRSWIGVLFLTSWATNACQRKKFRSKMKFIELCENWGRIGGYSTNEYVERNHSRVSSTIYIHYRSFIKNGRRISQLEKMENPGKTGERKKYSLSSGSIVRFHKFETIHFSSEFVLWRGAWMHAGYDLG